MRMENPSRSSMAAPTGMVSTRGPSLVDRNADQRGPGLGKSWGRVAVFTASAIRRSSANRVSCSSAAHRHSDERSAGDIDGVRTTMATVGIRIRRKARHGRVRAAQSARGPNAGAGRRSGSSSRTRPARSSCVSPKVAGRSVGGLPAPTAPRCGAEVRRARRAMVVGHDKVITLGSAGSATVRPGGAPHHHVVSADSASSRGVSTRERQMAAVVGKEQPFELPAIFPCSKCVLAHDDPLAESADAAPGHGLACA